MLNSGAPGVMLDVEDSLANTWANLVRGHRHAVAALHGDLAYFDAKRNRQVPIQPSRTVVFTRVRGLHLSQAGVFDDGPMSASLFDLALHVFLVDPGRLKHPLCIYIPKSESAEEALWWREALRRVARAKGLAPDAIKCMALVEAHPLAYQMEEFLFHLREHVLGLNLGRWDYMASLIHFHLPQPRWVLPDRNTIPHDVPFFQRLRERMPEICHRHGLLAIGGMTALYPSRVDAELNARALAVLEKDKRNEAQAGMDGAWTGHPDQNAIAVAQFPQPNQLGFRRADLDAHPDLRPVPDGVGRRTIAGSRTAARVTMLYRYGVLSGRGASLIEGYMEDLATDRIYRLMLAQRTAHHREAPVLDESENGQGVTVPHTPELVTQLYDEELESVRAGLGKDLDPQLLKVARTQSEQMVVNGWHDPV